MANPRSMVMAQVGGRTYPLVSHPNCRTCQSPFRQDIERGLLQGLSLRVLVGSLTGLPQGVLPHPNKEGIKNHKEHHMPFTAQVQRRIIERRAEQLGRDIEEAGESLIDGVTAAELTVQKGFERMANGEISPNVTEMLAAAKFLREVEKDAGGGIDEQAFYEILSAYMETVVKFIPQDRMQEFALAMRTHPVIAAQQRRMQQEPDHEVIESLDPVEVGDIAG